MINVQAMVKEYNDCYATVQRQDQKLGDTNGQNIEDCTGDDIDAGIVQEQDQCADGAADDAAGVVGEQDQSSEDAVDDDGGVVCEQDPSPPDDHRPRTGVPNHAPMIERSEKHTS